MKKAFHKQSLVMVVLLTIMFSCQNPIALIEGNQSSENSSLKQGHLLIDDGDYYVLGGDILLDKNDPELKNYINYLKGDVSNSRGVVRSGIKQWPNGKIPYYYAEFWGSSFSQRHKTAVEEAMAIIEKVCNVDFYYCEGVKADPKTAGYVQGLFIVNNPYARFPGEATIGYQKHAKLTLRSFTKGTILHELLHCLGMGHEHQRPDRDNFITVHYENVEPEFKDIMDVALHPLPYDSKTYGPYDYDSIMHYGAGSLAKPETVVIDGRGHSIGQRNELSRGDIETLQYMYGGTLEIGYDHLPRGFAHVNNDGRGRADFYRFVGDGSGIFLSAQISRNQSFMPTVYGFNSAKGIDVGYSHLPRGMADVNDDGQADYYRFVGNASQKFLSVMLAGDNGFKYQYGFNSARGIDVGYSHLPRGMADVNKDGRADYYRFVGDSRRPFLSVMLAKENGFGYQYEFNSPAGIDLGYSHLPRGMADVNGDKRADFYRFVGDIRRPFLSVMLATENGFGYQYGYNSATGIDVGYSDLARGMADVNGDGKADFYRFVGNGSQKFLSAMLAGDNGFEYQYGFNSSIGVDAGYKNILWGMADITGDKRADYYRLVGPSRSMLSVLVAEENGFDSNQYRWNLVVRQ